MRSGGKEKKNFSDAEGGGGESKPQLSFPQKFSSFDFLAVSVWYMASQHILPSRWGKKLAKNTAEPHPIFFSPVYGGPAVSVRGVRTLFHPGQNGKPRETEVRACVLLPPFPPPPPLPPGGVRSPDLGHSSPPLSAIALVFRVSGWVRKGFKTEWDIGALGFYASWRKKGRNTEILQLFNLLLWGKSK